MTEPLEELVSPAGTARARIFRRADGMFQVTVEIFMRASPMHGEPSWWSCSNGPVELTDSYERARELAREGLLAASSSQ